MMKIKGLSKLTLLDYPGKVACIAFLGGCDFRCPYCHNMEIVLDSVPEDYIDEDYFFDFLKKRSNMLEGVCVTGGEPLMSGDITEFLSRIKGLGYLVKLDTNGSYPERLKELVANSLIDYVALDIKNSPKKYVKTAFCTPLQFQKVEESLAFLLEGKVDYELRTTVAKPLHTVSDLEEIGRWIQGAKRYYIQNFAYREGVPDRTLTSVGMDELQMMLQAVKKYLQTAELRGV